MIITPISLSLAPSPASFGGVYARNPARPRVV
jgi:hypothetical protein